MGTVGLNLFLCGRRAGWRYRSRLFFQQASFHRRGSGRRLHPVVYGCGQLERERRCRLAASVAAERRERPSAGDAERAQTERHGRGAQGRGEAGVGRKFCQHRRAAGGIYLCGRTAYHPRCVRGQPGHLFPHYPAAREVCRLYAERLRLDHFAAGHPGGERGDLLPAPVRLAQREAAGADYGGLLCQGVERARPLDREEPAGYSDHYAGGAGNGRKHRLLDGQGGGAAATPYAGQRHPLGADGRRVHRRGD